VFPLNVCSAFQDIGRSDVLDEIEDDEEPDDDEDQENDEEDHIVDRAQFASVRINTSFPSPT
jgi:hypothetical protein